MLKKIGCGLVFLLLFALIFLAVSPVFVPKNNSAAGGIYDPNAKGFLAEEPNTLDVLFLGDSEAYSAFIPLKLWEDQGISSYVCATGDQVMYQSLSYLDRVLQTQSPQVVILETNTLYREYTLDQLASHYAQELFPYLRYHNRWKTLASGDFFSPVTHTTQFPHRGYIYHTEVEAANTEGYMAPSDEYQPVPWLNVRYTRLLRDRCREAGIRLILVSTPSPVNWSIFYHNGVTRMCDDLGIPFIDMNRMPQEVPIDWEMDSYDGGDHLNYTGACKVTGYLGEYLRDTGLFSDRRTQTGYEHWNRDLEEFRRSQPAS